VISSMDEIEQALQSILDYQLVMEAGDQLPADELVPAIAFDRLAHHVVNMCQFRRRSLLKPGGGNEVTKSVDLNALLDVSPCS